MHIGGNDSRINENEAKIRIEQKNGSTEESNSIADEIDMLVIKTLQPLQKSEQPKLNVVANNLTGELNSLSETEEQKALSRPLPKERKEPIKNLNSMQRGITPLLANVKPGENLINQVFEFADLAFNQLRDNEELFGEADATSFSLDGPYSDHKDILQNNVENALDNIGTLINNCTDKAGRKLLEAKLSEFMSKNKELLAKINDSFLQGFGDDRTHLKGRMTDISMEGPVSHFLPELARRNGLTIQELPQTAANDNVETLKTAQKGSPKLKKFSFKDFIAAILTKLCGEKIIGKVSALAESIGKQGASEKFNALIAEADNIEAATHYDSRP